MLTFYILISAISLALLYFVIVVQKSKQFINIGVIAMVLLSIVPLFNLVALICLVIFIITEKYGTTIEEWLLAPVNKDQDDE
jgi:hypothetical protein